MQNPRYAAFKALSKVENEGAYSNIVLDSVLSSSEMSKLDSSFASSLFYGVLEKKLSLDYIISKFSSIPIRKIEPDTLIILRIAVFQLVFMDKIPDSAAVNEAVKLCKKVKLFSSSGFVNGVLRSIVRSENRFPLPDERNKAEYLSVKYSCPKKIIKLWSDDYSEECAEKILMQLDGRPPVYARVNTLKTNTEELLGIFKKEGVNAQKTDILSNAAELKYPGAISELESFKKGLFHIQDLSSQICCEILNVRKGDTVTDVCSAPGGKAFTTAENMNNTGKIFCCDIHSHKLKLIRGGAKRLGINTIDVCQRDALSDVPLEMSDRILCDVPCSGLGILRRKPEIRYKSDTGAESLPKIQYDILVNSSKYVKSGGILVYSTCTLHRAENGGVADKFLAENTDFAPLEIKLPKGIKRTISEPENQVTLFPQTNNTDGFFISAFVKR